MLNRKGTKIGTGVHVYVQLWESVYLVKLVSFFFLPFGIYLYVIVLRFLILYLSHLSKAFYKF